MGQIQKGSHRQPWLGLELCHSCTPSSKHGGPSKSCIYMQGQGRVGVSSNEAGTGGQPCRLSSQVEVEVQVKLKRRTGSCGAYFGRAIISPLQHECVV